MVTDVKEVIKLNKGVWCGMLEAGRAIGIEKISFYRYNAASHLTIQLGKSKEDDTFFIDQKDLISWKSLVSEFVGTTGMKRIFVENAKLQIKEEIAELEECINDALRKSKDVCNEKGSGISGRHAKGIFVKSINSSLIDDFIKMANRSNITINFYIDSSHTSIADVRKILSSKNIECIAFPKIPCYSVKTQEEQKGLILEILKKSNANLCFTARFVSPSCLQSIGNTCKTSVSYMQDIYNNRGDRKIKVVKRVMGALDIYLYRDEESNTGRILEIYEKNHKSNHKLKSVLETVLLSSRFDKVVLLDSFINCHLAKLLRKCTERLHLLKTIKELHILKGRSVNAAMNSEGQQEQDAAVDDFIEVIKMKAPGIKVYKHGKRVADSSGMVASTPGQSGTMARSHRGHEGSTNCLMQE